MNNFAEFVKAFCDFGLEMVELSVTTRWHLNQVKTKFSILKVWSYIYIDVCKIFRKLVFQAKALRQRAQIECARCVLDR